MCRSGTPYLWLGIASGPAWLIVGYFLAVMLEHKGRH